VQCNQKHPTRTAMLALLKVTAIRIYQLNILQTKNKTITSKAMKYQQDVQSNELLLKLSNFFFVKFQTLTDNLQKLRNYLTTAHLPSLDNKSRFHEKQMYIHDLQSQPNGHKQVFFYCLAKLSAKSFES